MNAKEQILSEKQEKRTYTTPQLTIYGSVAEITAQNKDWGNGDGFTFQSQPIQWTS